MDIFFRSAGILLNRTYLKSFKPSSVDR
ncbi:hypothetical protein RDI58_024412 [Solanum bulbocastanum]|uniref:Uncharacterized protein n=1 Tax=Solanum bulbocastanum TaxID=147425 RepID=A0AAN8T188_SOLBU